ncbi:MAG: histidine--tRNA ligase [Ignavibacteriales bacterium]|nr:histidine--tRNA ligase [Ignavibacteriales bacterium]
MKYRAIKGTKDILPNDVGSWQLVEGAVHRVMRDFNYKELRTPIFEQTALFARSIGELTDIVSKEMYTFTDRGNESVTLRPEGTAAALRAYIQNNLSDQSPLTKVYYLGPMFRQERPQAGRLRQFHQFGAEALGGSSPLLDVEMMLLPMEIYRQLGVATFSLKVNSVGCDRCRPPYKEFLRTELLKIQRQLSADCQARIHNNPLRVLDSKDANDRRLTANAPLIKDHLCEECKSHFTEVQRLLDTLQTVYEIDGRLVRGLDYYTKTAFEITSTALGSQDALAGGGRYDLLVEELGGKPTPGVGFAAGIERLLMVLEKISGSLRADSGPVLFVVALDDASRRWTFAKATELRSKGAAVELDYLGRSVKAQMREANRQNAQYVLVVGESELASRSAKLKNMQTGYETPVSLDNFTLPIHSPA